MVDGGATGALFGRADRLSLIRRFGLGGKSRLAWNVRLIPHYSLGVWFVIIHMGLGLRGVLLARRVSPPAAGRVASGVCALGAVLAMTITVAQLSVRGVP